MTDMDTIQNYLDENELTIIPKKTLELLMNRYNFKIEKKQREDYDEWLIIMSKNN